MPEKSHPAWGAWIEMINYVRFFHFVKSHPAWGAWIEIRVVVLKIDRISVAPRMGCVD